MQDTSWLEEARTNASKLESEIDRLRHKHRYSNTPFLTVGYRYREFWLHSKEIATMFKGTKLTKEDRGRLWADYSAICQEVTRKQGEGRAESDRNRSNIDAIIKDAYFQASGASDRAGLDKATWIRDDALRRMQETHLTREAREHCWKYWKEASEKIVWKRNEIQKSNYLQAKELADRCLNASHYDDPYKALEEIKEAQRSLKVAYVNKEQRNDVFGLLETAYLKTSSRIDEIKQQRRMRFEESIDRWESSLSEAEYSKAKVEENISKLEAMVASARGDEYANRVRGWIGESYEKLRDINNLIQQLETKIYSSKGKLDR